MPDALGPWPLDALLADTAQYCPGLRVEYVPSIDSTNSELMRRARAGSADPVLLVAGHQTAGRGRLGRTWVSQTQGHALTFSLGLALEPRDWSGLSLAVGLSVARSLHPELRLKWPNDLWYAGRKLAGILIETVQGPAQRYAVIGIGVNIDEPHAAGLSVPPAWLRELLPRFDAPAALACLVGPLLRDIRLFEHQGLAPFLPGFRARDLLHGREVVLSNGASGTAMGIDSGGGLLVHTPAGMKTITSAEVSVRAIDHGVGPPGTEA